MIQRVALGVIVVRVALGVEEKKVETIGVEEVKYRKVETLRACRSTRS